MLNPNLPPFFPTSGSLLYCQHLVQPHVHTHPTRQAPARAPANSCPGLPQRPKGTHWDLGRMYLSSGWLDREFMEHGGPEKASEGNGWSCALALHILYPRWKAQSGDGQCMALQSHARQGPQVPYIYKALQQTWHICLKDWHLSTPFSCAPGGSFQPHPIKPHCTHEDHHLRG